MSEWRLYNVLNCRYHSSNGLAGNKKNLQTYCGNVSLHNCLCITSHAKRCHFQPLPPRLPRHAESLSHSKLAIWYVVEREKRVGSVYQATEGWYISVSFSPLQTSMPICLLSGIFRTVPIKKRFLSRTRQIVVFTLPFSWDDVSFPLYICEQPFSPAASSKVHGA